MNLRAQHIRVNGELLAIDDLLNKKATTPWKQDFYNFLKEWYSDKDYIEVQTSGSTGKAKTIELKKAFVGLSANRTLHYFELQANDKILHCLPVKYIAGKLMVVRALLGQLDLHLHDPTTDFRFLLKQQFKFAAMVPTQFLKFMELETSNVQQILIGGDAISNQLLQQIQHIKTPCFSSYGMTETATHIAIRKLNGKDASNFYKCLENIEVKLDKNSCLQIFMPQLANSPLQTTDLAEVVGSRKFRRSIDSAQE